jgi:hypothetical protein
VFSWFDWLAVAVGIIAILFGGFKSKNRLKLNSHFTNFCSGASSLYLIIIAYGIAKDPALFKAVATSNSVLLCASLVFAAFVNLQIVVESVKPVDLTKAANAAIPGTVQPIQPAK